ncbi:uncharacterized protein BJ212DRAFT_1277864 [Suillus subaureus]|uniref:Uncharacterized protein n=1 Tax=Suillus subaureus TaxID=48587 RepID=A0A9P7JAQ2_9AGAM|nr:uncharacterized protein BJ212DRAFT_1277864 [Suillus subaureus]KAG1811371.1 hypothetical protein BJ212DRAFT_1277864 [Suillus subaureus]
MATRLLSTLTVYPDIEFQGINQGPLQLVLLTICFSGKLPMQVIKRNMPVQISVSFGEEYVSFTSPVVEVVSMDLCSSSGESTHPDGTVSDANSPAHQDVSDDIQILFLPLRHFDNSDWNTWATLSKNIESWLVDIGSETQLWMWGHNTFWLAFIVAYPLFPRGSWPKWDSHIPLEGSFIEQWLEQSGDHTMIEQEQDSIRVDIWDKFCKHAALFFPHSLVVSD